MLINVSEELAAEHREDVIRDRRGMKRDSRGAMARKRSTARKRRARRRDGATTRQHNGAAACGMRAGATAVSQQTYSNKRSSAMSTIV